MTNKNDNAGAEIIVIFAIIVMMLAAWILCVVAVPAGNVGVVDTFGVVENTPMQPGLHIKAPWTGINMFSTQTQSYKDSGTPGDTDVAQIQALSNEGLSITMEIAVLYHIDPNAAPGLYKSVGSNYQDVIMKQPIHAVPRDIISKYDAMTLYGASIDNSNTNGGRVQIEKQLFDGISKGVLNPDGTSRGIVIENVFLRNVILPQSLTSSIESKLSMQQQIQEKQFEVQKQEAEAQRQVAEAHGIADSNKIIAGSLSNAYLEWYTIEMMKTHSGATYFIPIGSDGRANPQLVLPLSQVAQPSADVVNST